MLRSLLLTAALVPLTAAGCASSTPAATQNASTGPDSAASTAVAMPAPVPITAGTDASGAPVAGHGLDVVERLAVGESVQAHGQTVTFVEVAEDSRCPEGTTCVWEGRAGVQLRVGDGAVRLTVPYASMRDGETASVAVDGVEVELVGLYPYPGSAEAEAGAPVEIGLTMREAGK